MTGTVEIRGTVIRIEGQGLVIQPKPQEREPARFLQLSGRCERAGVFDGDDGLDSSRG